MSVEPSLVAPGDAMKFVHAAAMWISARSVSSAFAQREPAEDTMMSPSLATALLVRRAVRKFDPFLVRTAL